MTLSTTSDSPTALAAVKTAFRFPASYAQQRLWFIAQMFPGGSAYNMPVAVRIQGPLEVDALHRSFQEIAARHESLRTTFTMAEGEPQQVIAEEIQLDLPIMDLRSVLPENREAEAKAQAEKEAWLPFDLSRGPLIRMKLFRLDEQDHVLVVTMHHIISDGWSIGVLIRELSLLYTAFSAGKRSPLPDLPIQYVDYTSWQRDWLRGEFLEQQVSYWKQQLAGIAPLDMPSDWPRPSMVSYRGSVEPVIISADLTEKLRKLGQRQEATLYMSLLAAFQVLLCRYSGQQDITVGSPVAGRRRPEMETLIGFFINTLILRAQVSGGSNFTQLLKQVRETTLQAYAHQDVPFEKLVEVLQPERDLGRAPLFQVMFVLQNSPQSGLQLGPARLLQFNISGNTAKFDLTLNLTEVNSGVQGVLGYSTDLFEAATVQRMIAHFQMLLSSIVAGPERLISDLSLLSAGERRQLLVDWTRTEPVLPRQCIHERFEAQAARTPAAPALSCEDKRLTYAELNARANQLAGYLRKLGVGVEDRVAICMERSADMVIALLGVLKVGATYVPLDPDYPSERLNYMLEDSQAAVLLTHKAMLERVAGYRGRLLEWESEQAQIEQGSGRDLGITVAPQNAAYVIYTSGSTGHPKGVVVTHGNVVRLMERTERWFNFNEQDVVTLFHSYAFDFSVWELWSALHYGGKLVVVPYWISRSPEDFLKLLKQEGVTVLSQTPSAFQQLSASSQKQENSAWTAAAPGCAEGSPRTEEVSAQPTQSPGCAEESLSAQTLKLRVVVFGGEALDYESLRAWLQRHPDQPQLINMYGITETTVHATYRPITLKDVEQKTGKSGIGVPIVDLKVYVLDEWMQPVPAGVKGELYVGGAGVARGYLRRAELTAERFVPNPYATEAGERLYRSGDQVSWKIDGNLDYYGRLDQQVKVRGFRIELGEIESALRDQSGVQQAVVLMREERGERQLVAYIVTESGRKMEEIREELRKRLPEYMVPAAWVKLERLPLTAHGKLDHKALPAPERESGSATYVAPRNQLEQRLAEIWAGVLKLERVGVEDNFFDLGGHSLLATQAVARIRDAFQIEVPLRQLFEHPTIAGLSAIISHSSSGTSLKPVFHVQPAVSAPSKSNGHAAVSRRSFLFPASFAQQRLWFIDQLEPGLPTYSVPAAARIQGELDVEALRKSFQEIVNRHETLRTTFMADGGEPQQVIWDELEMPLPVFDLRSLPAEQREIAVRTQIEEDARVPFDLIQGPLLRLKLFQLDEQDHVIEMNLHHIITDAWSMGVLMRELSALYDAFSVGKPSPLPDLSVQYVDYTAWQREWLQQDVLEKQINYWKRQLAGAPTLDLSSDRPRPPLLTYRGGAKTVTVPAGLVDKLKEMARQQGATLYMTLLAACHALLYRYSGQQDITIGSPIAGRRRPEMEPLIGFFVNTLVLRADVSGNMGFIPLLQQVKETTLEAYAHQDVPFERLVELLQPERDLSRTPLFQVMFVLQNVPPAALELGSAKLQSFPFGTVTAKFELTFILTETSSGLQGGIGFSDIFDDDTIERMIEHFQKLLSGIVAEPQRRLAELPLLTREEEKQVVEQWNRTGRPYPQQRWVHEMFMEQAAQAPNEVAVTYEADQLTYAELNERSNQLAHYLIANGVGPDERVGICMKRSLGMIIGLLGIVKAGGAYIPLDPAYPQSRLEYMLENSAMRMMLTENEFRELLPQHSTRQLVLDEAWPEISKCSQLSPDVQVSEDNIAYVIYTSGSTGKPKGVALPHRALSNLIHWQLEGFEFRLKNILQFTSLSFDVSVQEIFSTFAGGGTLHLIDDDKRRDIPQLRHLVTQRHIERLFLPFVALDYLSKAYLEEDSPECPLREVLCGGEQLQITPAIMQLFQRAQNAVLVNHYGPSETHLSNTYTLSGDSAQWPKLPPVGKPIANAQLYVLNAWMELAPLGVPGELFIAGAGMARGYLNNPDLTAERFVPNPFSHTAGDRLYKTGDIVRWRKDGEMEYLGRIDGQVKIRGYRIELGEIETVLRQHPAVEQAVVVVREDEQKQKRLIAYVVLRQEIAASELREQLQGRLPEYMVPAIFMVLEKVPLTPSGKTDRRALPPPPTERQPDEQTAVAPRTPTEELLAQIWTTILGRTEISMEDDFFALGGHSLLATQVTARIRNVFHVEVPLRRIFEASTISRLGKVVEQLTAASTSEAANSLRRVPRDGFIPLSYAQQRLWFIDQLTPGQTVYNMPAAVRVAGPLDVQALQHTVNEIYRRHESLRTRFSVVEGEPQQAIAPPSAVDLPLLDLSSTPEEEREAEARKIAVAEAQTPFDLERGPLFRVKLLRLADDDHVLVTNMHHIISDAWSLGVLMREVSVLYQAFSASRPSPLPELTIQYPDYSAWQREWLRGEILEQQISYWKQQLAGVEPLDLPIDRSRPSVVSYRGAGETVSIPADTTEKLRKLGQRHGTTLYMALLSAFQVLLSRYSGQQDISVGSPVAGRRQSELEPLIGFFINTLVLRTQVSGGLSFTQLLKQVRETTLQAYAHQDVPFEKLVEALQPERDLGRTPLFQVLFVLQNAPQSGLQLGPARLLPFSIGGSSAKFEITFSLTEINSELQGGLGYSTDLFEAATIQRMIAHYQMLLEGIVTNPERVLSDLPLLTEIERQQLLVDWNQTELPSPPHEDKDKDKLLLDLIEEQVERIPEAEAVVHGTQSLTYRELNRQANQLARYLQKLGVGPEVRVGICVERSLKMIVGLLGIMKAGGAYVPLDPEYPAERVHYMLEDTQAPVLLSQQKLLSQLPAYAGRVVSLDQQWPEIERENADNLERAIFPDSLAYLIYTSGSTGRPKGVAIRHSSAAVLVKWAPQVFSQEELHGILASTSICFDVSVFEIFVTLSCGGRMLLVGNALDLAEMREPERVKVVTTVPSAMRELARMKAIPESVRTVGLGGEAVPLGLPREIYEASQAERVLNLYGPSEDTTYTTWALLSRTQERLSVPVGRPVTSTQLYVLDAALNPVPVGIPGELYIGGAGLARGYWDRPELTAEKFVPNPFSQQGGERLYRTGDLVRYRTDGNLEFLSRLDHQVKVRGHRIELGEIETVLEEQPKVKQAVVLAREDQPGDKWLVAYVVLQDARVAQPPGPPVSAGFAHTGVEVPSAATEESLPEDLQRALKQRLPEYMVPSAFIMLDQMPLTPNGKINRKALPAPSKDRATASAGYIAPRTAMEEALAEIWCKVLGLERVGVEDNFFDLGGHSLLAVRLRAMLRNRLNYNLSLVELFQNPTIARMAKRKESVAESLPPQILVPIQPHGSHSPLFCIHAIGGQIFCYNQLSRELGTDRPFYGLQAPAADQCETIEQMASLYIREIRQVQKHGPYLLGGWSMGGLIAFEMARQLKAEGDSIAMLAMFDSYPPSRKPRLNTGDNQVPMLARFALEMARSLGRDVTVLQEQFAKLQPEEQKKLVLDELVQAEILPSNNAEAEFMHLFNIYTSNLQAMENYSPTPQNQSIVLLKATESNDAETIAKEWKQWATGGVEFHPIPGNHYTILQRPNVTMLASALAKSFNDRE